MSSTAERTQEQRIRRMADRQGLALRKSRRRDAHAPDYGQMWLLTERVWNGARWELVASPEQSNDAWIGPFDSLNAVEAHLKGNR